MPYLTDDTICAIATPQGIGGIAVIRVSGRSAHTICDSIFRSSMGKAETAPGYTILYGDMIAKDGRLLDSVLVSVFREPRSYTGENTVEISCHGGMTVAKLILEELIRAGCRMAMPGEFSKRAFLNGKMDMTQAEGIIDMIHAESETAVFSAASQMKGRLRKKIEGLREQLLVLSAKILAVLDYPEDDIEPYTGEEFKETIQTVLDTIDALLKNAEHGKIVRSGISAAIVGKPNAGKSSLMNSLLQEDRAIVTHVAGTTRDILCDYLNIDGVIVKLMDTAGLRETEDLVEGIGVERTREAICQSDMILYTVDLSEPLSKEDDEIISAIENKPVLVILNKSDLPIKCELSRLDIFGNKVTVSAKTGEGVQQVFGEISRMMQLDQIKGQDFLLTNIRHIEKLEKTRESLLRVLSGLEDGIFYDILSIDLADALTQLGEISGIEVNKEIVDRIFDEFCLGK